VTTQLVEEVVPGMAGVNQTADGRQKARPRTTRLRTGV
jgi:hypothetical protein